MKIIMGILGVGLVLFVIMIYAMCKVVGEIDQAEEERLRELYFMMEEEERCESDKQE